MTGIEAHIAAQPDGGLTPRRRRILLSTLLTAVVVSMLGRAFQDEFSDLLYNVVGALAVLVACFTVVALVAFTAGRGWLTRLVVLAGFSLTVAQILSITEDISALDNVFILGTDDTYHHTALSLSDFLGLSLWIIGFFGVVFELSRAKSQLAERSQALLDEMHRNQTVLTTLTANEGRYQQLLEATSVIPWEADAVTFEFTYIGPQVETILGYPPDAWREPGFWASVLHPEDRDEAVQFCRSQTEQSRNHELDYRMVLAKGEVRWIRDIVTVVGDGRTPTLLQGIFVDITEIKEAEKEQQGLQEQMQHAQKLESLGVLAGGIAHDFNNFLTGILGNADLALHHPEAADESLETIVTTARRAGELCQQLLAYSGRGKIVVKPHDLSAIVTEIGDLLEVPVSKKAEIRYALASDLPSIEGESTQIRQVIMNLVTNAAESIEHPPGRITITTSVTTVDESGLESADEGEVLPGRYVFVDVADDGSGMDQQTKARMFDPFYTTKFSGRGLGLAAVLGIMRGHGGGICVDSTLGSGTTVRLLFPASDKLVRPEVGAAKTNRNWRGEGTILVVDDEAVIRDFVSQVLIESGFDVITAEDGVQAVKHFREHAHNLAGVVLDLTMPNMDGAEAHREMRLIREGIPVVVISGFSEKDVTHSFSGTSLGAFLQKPFRASELLDALRGAMI